MPKLQDGTLSFFFNENGGKMVQQICFMVRQNGNHSAAPLPACSHAHLFKVGMTLALAAACLHPCLPSSPTDEDCVTTLRGERICEPRSPSGKRAASKREDEPAPTQPDADTTREVAASFLHLGMEVVDWDARVFKVPNFLSDSEVDALLALGRGTLDDEFGLEWRTKHAYATTFFTKAHYQKSEVLQAFEERVSRLTMVKGHAHEAPAMFTRQIPGAAAGSFIPDQALRNVHHDKNQRENRVVTVLVYLTTARDGDGGHTLFPCLPAKGEGKTGRRISRRMAREFARLFDNGTRVIDSKLTSDVEMDLFRTCNEQCRLAHR